MVTHSILATVEKGRLQKAVEGLVSGAYTISVTGQSEVEVSGFVANGDGKEYGVVLTESRAFCSCPDAMFRHTVCKHAVVLALQWNDLDFHGRFIEVRRTFSTAG